MGVVAQARDDLKRGIQTTGLSDDLRGSVPVVHEDDHCPSPDDTSRVEDARAGGVTEYHLVAIGLRATEAVDVPLDREVFDTGVLKRHCDQTSYRTTACQDDVLVQVSAGFMHATFRVIEIVLVDRDV